MNERTELDPEIHRKIASLSEKGDALAAQGQHEAAVALYNQAWELIPEPRNRWEASTWVLAAIADSCSRAAS